MKKALVFSMLLTFTSIFSQEKLEDVKVTGKQKGIKKSLTKTANTTLVSSKELLKAACCNLAESFETNPSIDVNFSDALTGTKQIKMLGLTSPYLMITEENIPSVRGASQAYGLSFTPGTWVESIQITKGAGSVVNGFESISGQINTELIKPASDIPFFLNAYGSTDSRFELNTHFNKKVSDKWATSLFVHGNARVAKNDMNDDGFLDNPLGKQLNIANRWQYSNPETGWVTFLNARYMLDEKQTGELDFNPDRDKLTTNYWGSEIVTDRFDFSSKVGYVFKDMPYQSIGFQNAFSNHKQESYFGLNQYNIKQQSYYSNLIFNSIISNTMHKFSTGLNFTYDKYAEFVNLVDVSRIDNSVGAFFEYTYDDTDKFSYILGGRVDYHNRLGAFFTPRLHVRYNPWEKSVFRFSAGRGKRAANIYAENQQLFASSRVFSVLDSNGKIYGLDPEIAWNYGISFTQNFILFGKSADVTLDFYRTDFQNQAVVDVMQSPQEVLFYNLRGDSYANSLQIDFNYEIVKHFNLRTAYKYYDISTDYLSGSFQRPLQAKHRLFGNLEYETHIKEKGQQWKFDFTLNWLGKQQLPYTASNAPENRLPDYSPSFSVMNAQITRTFSSTFEMYIGGENIGNYRQDKAILGANDPFGTSFDTSIVYAPVFGQMYYAGLRFKIK
ncbi:TonB-dependent receptor plug domain-containing protein [Flavobacterium aquatile]|uniref:TonB-dependent receptor n=1 Tax=Flavobacterium aquatile LMG 4008 = ATCC 11947 TaxID=1453498 RepID=A0A095STN3_9FLAO|nr:TonB-dependent receptor [Flavobacterium aquatile]KGD67952.1 TonB-dependent receptor [Flavobacterium aquatile LMG 4008 = ATCC 11947]OXA65372.1 TonB-dependent receptor [Flavobacterium aquatile] [Flavobacterium aquatile LMG 4008 = ATCC 11947]GEC78932.1 TonB-dependent receptor [Flavobacterium aquatile]